jgi:D-sedoheptulose 7-phosphate isomerase
MSKDHISASSLTRNYLTGVKTVLDALSCEQICTFIEHVRRAYEDGRQVFIVGNGGSAATASHMACDFGKTALVGRDGRSGKRFRVIALTDNVPLITAWANDASFSRIFSEQLRNLANSGDLLIVITASGNSPNILEAIKAGKELGMMTIGMLGFSGGAAREMLDDYILVDKNDYGPVEDVHLILNHLITHYLGTLLSGDYSGHEAVCSLSDQRNHA